MRIPGPGQQRVGTTRTLLTGPDGSIVKRSILPGGLRVISENVPSAHSASIGFWIGVGSRDETAKTAGASHFLEHLLFKGTQRRSAFEISAAIEAVGGDLNAFTTKECTCFHARVLAQDLPLAIDVLADMMTDSTVTRADVDAERNVVIEEIAMYEDEPSDVAIQDFDLRAYGKSKLADPVIGSVQSIATMSRATVWNHYRKHYRPPLMVVAAAGAIDHAQLVRDVKKATKGWATDRETKPVPARADGVTEKAPNSVAGCNVVSKPIEQANVVLGVPGLEQGSDRRWALAVLDTALGSGMSSRLFQEVREKRSLVYAVQSFRAGYSDAGVFGVYAGTQPDKVDECVDVVRSVLAEAAENGITDDEVARAKGQLRGSSVLESEDAAGRMSRLGKAELLTGELLSLDDVVAEIDRVTPEQVARIARELLTQPETMTVVGPFKSGRVFGSDQKEKKRTWGRRK